MELGLLYSFRNPPQWRMAPDRVYEETLQHIARMEEVGLDTVWLTEHHFSEDGYLPSLNVMAAAVAMRTSRVTIGHAIIELPLHHPVQVAEQVAICDILSGGRMRLGIGLGRVDHRRPSFDAEGEAFGVPNTPRRASIFEEQIEIIRQSWSDEPLNFHGRYFDMPRVSVTPKPLQRPGPEIWFGVGINGLHRAARMGDGWVGGGNIETVRAYLKAVKEAGREREAGKVVVFMNSYPAADPERAEAEFGRYNAYLTQWYGGTGNSYRFATPDVVAGELRAWREAGATGALWFAPFAGASPLASLPIYEAILREVKPALG